MKAKNLAVDPGNASTSESNSEALTKQVTRTPTAEEIQKRAYEMCVERGGVHRFDTDDWLPGGARVVGSQHLRIGPKQATGEFSAEETIPIACTN